MLTIVSEGRVKGGTHPKNLCLYGYPHERNFAHGASAQRNSAYSSERYLFWRSLPLQRHLRVLTKSTHVESRFCGRSRQVKVAFCTPVNPCVRSVCSRSVVVGLLHLIHALSLCSLH